MADDSAITNCRPKRLASIRRLQSSQAHTKQELRKKLRKVSNILKKKEAERTEDEVHTLHQFPDVVKAAEKNAKKKLQQKERILEIEDDPDILDQKCQDLAQMLLAAKNAIVYTGAGISTAASIPDYRGPNGVWTLLRKGQALRAQDLVDAEPTYTHMCITKLFKMGRVKHLVSQNCDGLHVRSGFPRHAVSEVHGNMFIEMCKNCKPQKEYLRLFDVTERTAKRHHKTGRTCRKCGGVLVDSIVHFGEKGGLKSPYRWKQACKAASKSDLIICLGSSLKVLRRYPCLWRMDIRPEQRPKLVIVNLQWTPKDEQASLKVHGRCDDVLRRVSQHIGLSVPAYHREVDPLFRLHTPVQKGEEHIASKKSLNIAALSPVGHKKVFHKVPKSASAQQPPLLWADCHQGRNSGVGLSAAANFQAFKSMSNFPDHIPKMEGTFPKSKPKCEAELESRSQTRHILGSETMSEYKFLPLAETNHAEKKFSSHLVNGSEKGASPGVVVNCENRHIPDPLRVKLEQMLKERGVVNSAVHFASCSKTPQGGRPSSTASSPLPSISNFLQHGGEKGVTQHHSHPNLRHLLSAGCVQSQPTPGSMDQEVFRVDLSTSPVSISTTLCHPEGAASQNLWITLQVADSASAAHGATTATAPGASVSDYAKLVRNMHFDHSYSKPAHKAHPRGKVLSAIRDSLNCSLTTPVFPQVQDSLSSSAASVIPSSGHDQWTLNQSSSEQNVEFSFQKQYRDSSPRAVFLSDCFLPAVTAVSSDPQEKVVVNLNAGTAFAFLTPAQSKVPAMQVHQEVTAAGAAQPTVSSIACDPSCSGTMVGENSDEDLENQQTSGRRKKPVSAPGWFGKGLRMKRKRTL